MSIFPKQYTFESFHYLRNSEQNLDQFNKHALFGNPGYSEPCSNYKDATSNGVFLCVKLHVQLITHVFSSIFTATL